MCNLLTRGFDKPFKVCFQVFLVTPLGYGWRCIKPVTHTTEWTLTQLHIVGSSFCLSLFVSSRIRLHYLVEIVGVPYPIFYTLELWLLKKIWSQNIKMSSVSSCLIQFLSQPKFNGIYIGPTPTSGKFNANPSTSFCKTLLTNNKI